MSTNSLNDKELILQRIQDNVPVFLKVSGVQYRIRCPFCGDSQKDAKKARLYLKCSDDITEPILYNCFNCSVKGHVDHEFFKVLGVSDNNLAGLNARRYNRLMTVRADNLMILTGEPNAASDQAGYIAYRLGDGFTIADLDRFKIVWDFNQLRQFVDNARASNTLPSNHDSISFLSDDRSVLLTRSFNDSQGWRKLRIRNSNARSLYTIKSTVDLMASDAITVHIAEGVFDVLSVFKHFNTGDNSLYIGCLGNDYRSAIDYSVAKGVFGKHVILRIYADKDIDRKLLKSMLSPYRWLFGTITMIWNTKAKDFGVLVENIVPVEIRV